MGRGNPAWAGPCHRRRAPAADTNRYQAMRRIPGFTLLRAFEAAGRLQSFAMAARELHLTPSAISHQVRELEQYFERDLFIRRHRRVELTAEGRRLLSGLTGALDALEVCCNEVSRVPSGQVLQVYCAPTFAVKWLGPRLPRFKEQHPDIGIHLVTGAEPVDLIEQRDLDIAITYFDVISRPGVDVLPLGKEQIAPLCAPSLINRRRPLREQIVEWTLIESQLNQVTWRDWFALNDLVMPEHPRQSFDRAALSIATAVDGMGVALESTRLAEREISRGELVIPGASLFRAIQRDVHFYLQRADEGRVNKVSCFRDWLIAQLDLKER